MGLKVDKSGALVDKFGVPKNDPYRKLTVQIS